MTLDHLVDINAIKKGGKTQKISDCDYCGCNHDKGNCPAYSKTCNKCGMKNHFEKKCRQNDSNHATGLEGRVTMTRSVNAVAPQRGKIFIQLRLILMILKIIVMMVVMVTTK